MEQKVRASRVLSLALAGAFTFFLAGLLNGWILLYSEFPWGFVAEGFIWGALFWIFIRERYKPIKVVAAAILADVLSTFIATFVGLTLPVPRFVAYMIMGIVMGIIFGGILGGKRGMLLFSVIGAVVFLIGGVLFDTVNVWSGSFVNWVNDIFGPMGWNVIAPGLTGIFKGMAMGLAMGVYEKTKEEMK